MKLAVLLARYFYQHKELSLPGIGIFTLDPAVAVPDASDKNFREFLQYIKFTQKPIQKPDEAFIDYIRSQTGKIKPLAESDLESYLADGKLLLNIGKPFHIEGIGSLQKNKSGIFEFTPGEPMLEKFEIIQENLGGEKQPRRKATYDESQLRHSSHNNQRRLLLVGTLVVIGLAVILWGGYSLYNKNTTPATEEAAHTTTPIQQIDSVQTQTPPANQPDTTTAVNPNPITTVNTPSVPEGNYKFIFEQTDRKARALRRYAFVKQLSSRIQMSTTDSLNFTIYVTLPATPADTGRLKDSLNAWYYGTKPIKVRIAQ